MHRALILLTLLAASLNAVPAEAQPWRRICTRCRCPVKGCTCQGGFHRAGHPEQVAWYARPGVTPDYDGYWVGGGAAWDGEPGRYNEGTWGWDYFGRSFRRNVALGWWHGRRYQGGTGAYETEGPHILPKK